MAALAGLAGGCALAALVLVALPALAGVARWGAVGSAVILVQLLVLYAMHNRPLRAQATRCGDLDLIRGIFEGSNEAIMVTDAETRIEQVNDAFCSITGYEREEAIGQKPSMMKSGRHDAAFYAEMWAEIIKTGRWTGEVWDRRKDGEVFAKWLSITTVSTSAGKRKYIGVFSDITPIKQAARHAEVLRSHDHLTRLPNRTLLADRMDQAMARAARDKRSCALMIVDIDRFKDVNSTLGHTAGDRLIVEMAARLKACVRRHDTVARLGGDEFALVLGDLDAERIAARVAEKVVAAIGEPLTLNYREVRVTASVGVTLFPQDGDDFETLAKNADMAMYHAKSLGKNRYQFFTPEMNERLHKRIHVENNLRLAIENNELVLHYQPMVSMHTGHVIGMEALVRRREADQLVPPGVFIPVAEETGLIIKISDWTLRESCRQTRLWMDQGLPPLRVAVNISSHHFNLQDFVPTVKSILAETGLPPALLELEVTERVVMADALVVIEKLKQLKELGVYLSIDDFGTGFSSLSYLNRFEVDKLKIDLSFVRDLFGPHDSSNIVRSIISLAHNMGHVVIAEGVEKESQLAFLKEHECDELQGFYYSMPLPPERFRDLVKARRDLFTDPPGAVEGRG